MTLTDSTLMRSGASNKHDISLPPIERPIGAALYKHSAPQSLFEWLKSQFSYNAQHFCSIKKVGGSYSSSHSAWL